MKAKLQISIDPCSLRRLMLFDCVWSKQYWETITELTESEIFCLIFCTTLFLNDSSLLQIFDLGDHPVAQFWSHNGDGSVETDFSTPK